MVPPDLGVYTVDNRPDCRFPYAIEPQERAPRRPDVGAPKWGRGGVPTQDTCRGVDVPGVLAVDETRERETLITEQGPVSLPFGPARDATFTPSAALLTGLPFTDSRITGISDRYYK